MLLLFLFVYAVSYILVYDDNFTFIKDYFISLSTKCKNFKPSLVEHIFDCQPCLSFWVSIPICVFCYGYLFFAYSLSCYAFTSIISDLTK